jgi:uncharacterized cupin superfamily protein
MSGDDEVELTPGVLFAAATVELEHEPLPDAQIVSGFPRTATLVLDQRDGREIGVWEITPGTASDFEVDEVFVVLAGRAHVEFTAVAEGAVPAPIDIGPGSVVRLVEGMQTTWTVHETLRKVYLA